MTTPLARAVLLSALSLTLALAGASASAQGNKPERVAFLGDSMMKLIGHQGSREMGKLPNVTVVTNFTSLGSGLARLEAFNWMAKFEVVMKECRPTLVIVALGTNDKQPMQMDDGRLVRPGDPDWTKEYGRRVGQAMDLMISGGATRVYWLELPDMKDLVHQADSNEINDVVRAQVEKRKTVVTFFEMRKHLSRKPGEYSKYMIGPGGAPLEVRDQDGVHLSRPGADLIIAKMIAAIGFQS